ncbi:MAG: BrnT family toxin [Xanthomonadales bacterium]|nr:BrnT family toxin [Xanthomonadales bacterium]MBK7145064.1 BrnT family toxin [Xanthomonadales bacterium]MCC6562625.1 BrnT family toxin [Xanthomonadales bacterium]
MGSVDGFELCVTYTLRDQTIRIISARKATRHEQRDYWKDR